MTYIVSADIKGLIFDFDGTLVDSMPAHLRSWSDAFACYGACFTETFFYENAGVSLLDVVKNYNLKFNTHLNPQAIVEKKRILHKEYCESINLIEPVFNIVKTYYLKLPMAIATGNEYNDTMIIIKKLRLEKYFTAMIFSKDYKHPKPAPDCFQKAAEAINIKPLECEVFEDSELGLLGAMAARMKATDIRKIINK